MNKTKVGKASRMLSALIVFTMLLALTPVTVIEASAEGGEAEQILVDFSQTTTTHDGTKYIITSSPGYTVVDELSTTGHKQMLTLGTNKILSVLCRGKNAHYWPRSNDYDYPENMYTRFTISVDVPVSGYYSMSLQGALYQEGGIASIYVDETYMGDYSFWDGTFKDNPHSRRMGETKQLNSVYLTAGPHNISFRNRYCPYWHPSGNPNFCLYKLWLDPLDEEQPTLESIEIDAPEEIESGESAVLSARALMSNGVPYGFAQYNEDGSAQAVNVISVTSSNPNVVSVSDVARAIGTPEETTATLTAVSSGLATITVNATVNGESVSAQHQVGVPGPVIIDFTQTTTTHDGTKWIITSSPGYTVVEEKSNPGDRRVYTYDGEKTLWKLVRGAGNWFWPRTNEQEPPENTYTMFTISVDVPVSGYYSMSLQGGLYHTGTIASIYADQTYMGDYSFWDGEYESQGYTFLLSDKKQLNSVYLTQGAHEISFRSRRSPGTQNAQLILYKLWLDPLDEEPVFDSVAITAPASIEKGSTAILSANALMSNGAPYGIAQYNEDGTAQTANTVSITSSDSSVVSVSNVSREIGTPETTAATLTANKRGSATITVSATIDGNTVSAQHQVNVTGPAELVSVTLTPAKTEIESEETITSSVTGVMDDDSAADLTGATITYESSNELVATVDENGVITGVAGGTADITVTVTLDGETFSDTKTITVTGDPGLTSLILVSPPTKTTYTVGEELDLSGLVVTGTYTDGSTGGVNITSANISGFDSSTDAPSQTLTVTVGGKTTTFDVKIVRVLDSISATGRITIDGYADEPAWEINKTLTRSKSGGDNTATFGTLWDEDNLYVFVDVVDDVLVTGSNKHYYDDGVEVYIDGDMVKGAYNEHSAQYTFRYGDDTVYVATADTVPPTASTEGVEHKTVETANGYAMEIKIPWSNIGGLTVNAGKTIGFTIHVNDKDTLGVPAGKVEDILTYTLESDDADFEDWLDSTNWAEMTLDAWSNPVEDSNDTGTVSIGAEGAPAGAITATVNGIPVDISNPGDLTLGDVVEMNADPEPDAGKKFLFWMDPVSKRLVSNQQQVTFTVGTDTQITAVYKDAGQGHIVIFFDRNGKVLNPDSYYYDSGDEIVQPENPYSVGYIFSGWSPAVPATANDDYAFVAQYEEEDDVTYEVTVENGSISPAGGSYKYNTQVTVTAGDFESGRKFAYWTKNGVIVSYSPNYSFYVWDDTEIRAVSVPISDNVTAAPAIYMDDNVKTDSDGEFSRLIFASERTMPAGYTLIETGILVSDESDIDLGSFDKKAVAQSASGSGQFTARVDGLTAGDTRYARAYMIYKTSGGDYKVIYSNTVVGTV